MAPNPICLAPLAFNHLPPPLESLVPLAYNLLWSWQPHILAPFAHLGGEGWSMDPNPVALLSKPWDPKDPVLKDPKFLVLVDKALKTYQSYMEGPAPLGGAVPGWVAYFCAEFGLSDTLPIYSGGLGVLAGDHTKEASDQGLPFVGVGLFYRQGFFHQYLAPPGRQEHGYRTLNPALLPMREVLESTGGGALRVTVPLGKDTVTLGVWHVAVGRAHLLLLDSHLPENSVAHRAITQSLYVSGREMRLAQEVLLGVGGARVLGRLGIEPHVWHLNEGHSAFLLVERLSRALAQGAGSLSEAAGQVSSKTVFTIHTPVPAGNERFDISLVAEVLPPILEAASPLTQDVLALGKGVEASDSSFDMTAFCLRLSRSTNGVSLLHGATAQGTWQSVSRGPVGGITNGIHLGTWVGSSVQKLMGSQDIAPGGAPGLPHLKGLWQAHKEQKERLIGDLKDRLSRQWARHGCGPSELAQLASGIQNEAFFIGFARRFAAYKRASLLFSDEKRLERILKNPKRPVHIVFSGKAHPADSEGQELISQIFKKTQEPAFRGHVYFVEDYSMALGASLVQGVDLWLNTPLRPLEASGTSGMKAAANGIPNFSTLDGWWDEGWDGTNGWAIGSRHVLDNPHDQALADAQSLYDQLEEKIIPLYFERTSSGEPLGYLEVMAKALSTGQCTFATSRMLKQYTQSFYGP